MKKHLEALVDHIEARVAKLAADGAHEKCVIDLKGDAFGAVDCPLAADFSIAIGGHAEQPALPAFPAREIRSLPDFDDNEAFFRDDFDDDEGSPFYAFADAPGDHGGSSEALVWLQLAYGVRLEQLRVALEQRHDLKISFSGHIWELAIANSVDKTIRSIAKVRRHVESHSPAAFVTRFLQLFTDHVDPAWFDKLRALEERANDPFAFERTLESICDDAGGSSPPALRRFFESGAYKQFIAHEIDARALKLDGKRKLRLDIMRDAHLDDTDDKCSPFNMYYGFYFDGEAGDDDEDDHEEDELGEARRYFPLFFVNGHGPYVVVDLQAQNLPLFVDSLKGTREPLCDFKQFLDLVSRG